MDFLFAGGVGFFTGFFPGLALWLLVTFGVPQLAVLAEEKFDHKNRFEKPLEKLCMAWVAVFLFGPPLVLLCLFLWRK